MPAEVTDVLIDRLARIEEKLDNLREHTNKSEVRYDSLERRVSRVERVMWVAIAVVGASSTANLTKIIEALVGGQ